MRMEKRIVLEGLGWVRRRLILGRRVLGHGQRVKSAIEDPPRERGECQREQPRGGCHSRGAGPRKAGQRETSAAWRTRPSGSKNEGDPSSSVSALAASDLIPGEPGIFAWEQNFRRDKNGIPAGARGV